MSASDFIKFIVKNQEKYENVEVVHNHSVSTNVNTERYCEKSGKKTKKKNRIHENVY